MSEEKTTLSIGDKTTYVDLEGTIVNGQILNTEVDDEDKSKVWVLLINDPNFKLQVTVSSLIWDKDSKSWITEYAKLKLAS